jgi:hypothetical protein
MGNLLPGYKASIIQEIKDNITGNNTHYYLYGSNPIEYANGTPALANNDYDLNFNHIWYMMFGKKIKATDIYPAIEKNVWVSNTIYERYDQTSNTLHTNNNFYIISEPEEIGGTYNIYKCIDNSNGAASVNDPGSIGTPTQQTTFETADGYKWRYITTISASIWDRFGTTDYVPVYANALLQASAQTYCGVDVVMITNSGSGYEAYTNGIIQSVVNTTVVQIANTSSGENFKYNNNSIYIYNTILGTSQIKIISNYISNGTGKWIYLSEAANTDIITGGVSEYIISPRVYFDTDGDTDPIAYTVVNTFSNAISNVIILDAGSNITRATATIISESGSGANLYCIIPPLGGHGADPTRELNVKGLIVAMNFSNSESNTIITSNAVYNKIGIIKNPYSLQANTEKGNRYSANTFDQLLKANVTSTYTLGETVIGETSGAKGVVVFSNSTQLYMVGDKHFANGEYIGNTTVSNSSIITINSLGDLYSKDLSPLYVQNINNLNRSDISTESYKIVIQI